MDESIYRSGFLGASSPVRGSGNADDHFGGGEAFTRGSGLFSEPGSPEASPGRARARGSVTGGGGVTSGGGGGGGAGMLSLPKVCMVLFVCNRNLRFLAVFVSG